MTPSTQLARAARYPDDPNVNRAFRGTQLVSLNQLFSPAPRYKFYQKIALDKECVFYVYIKQFCHASKQQYLPKNVVALTKYGTNVNRPGYHTSSKSTKLLQGHLFNGHLESKIKGPLKRIKNDGN
jgi:hypothetical protein